VSRGREGNFLTSNFLDSSVGIACGQGILLNYWEYEECIKNKFKL
jgi:hypothetical protein